VAVSLLGWAWREDIRALVRVLLGVGWDVIAENGSGGDMELDGGAGNFTSHTDPVASTLSTAQR
jgi:hypothetical protein